MTEPRDFLRSALSKLAKRGCVYIDVPNQDYRFKKNVFPHLLFFNRDCLKLLMQGCGIQVSAIGCYGNSMNASPLHFSKKMAVERILGQIISRFRILLTEKWLIAFFSRYFDMDRQNDQGVWIRAIGQPAEKS